MFSTRYNDGGDFLNSILIVSSSKKGIDFFTEILSESSYEEIVLAKNGGEARRILIDRDFDLCIINAPLLDEFGDGFAMNVANDRISQVILVEIGIAHV